MFCIYIYVHTHTHARAPVIGSSSPVSRTSCQPKKWQTWAVEILMENCREPLGCNMRSMAFLSIFPWTTPGNGEIWIASIGYPLQIHFFWHCSNLSSGNDPQTLVAWPSKGDGFHQENRLHRSRHGPPGSLQGWSGRVVRHCFGWGPLWFTAGFWCGWPGVLTHDAICWVADGSNNHFRHIRQWRKWFIMHRAQTSECLSRFNDLFRRSANPFLCHWIAMWFCRE